MGVNHEHHQNCIVESCLPDREPGPHRTCAYSHNYGQSCFQNVYVPACSVRSFTLTGEVLIPMNSFVIKNIQFLEPRVEPLTCIGYTVPGIVTIVTDMFTQ